MSEPERIREGRQTSVRLGGRHDRMLERIKAEKRWGDVTAIRAALEELDRQIFGRRSPDADAVPIRTTPRRPTTPRGR